jgi:hypothetical protein
LAFQANSKSIKIQQSPAKPEQRQSKEKAWIVLDFLVRNEPFQRVAPTPQGIFSFFRIAWLELILVMYFCRADSRRVSAPHCSRIVDWSGHGASVARASIFRKLLLENLDNPRGRPRADERPARRANACGT